MQEGPIFDPPPPQKKNRKGGKMYASVENFLQLLIGVSGTGYPVKLYGTGPYLGWTGSQNSGSRPGPSWTGSRILRPRPGTGRDRFQNRVPSFFGSFLLFNT
uniref:Uncharacterized protein n=1 Tax=Opuntia streptacantha TaxID=393608 RepID=A0A7C9D0Q1_OPUST